MDAFLRRVLAEPELFSRCIIGRELRPYQLEAMRAILDSVWHKRGLTFTVMLARQMGKNELSAHLECYLLNLFRRRGGIIIKAAPTFRPQAIISRLRLRQVLDNPWNRRQYRESGGYTFELGRARLMLLSGAPEANVVGATANILLEIDEAQDFSPEKYDRDFRPMGATANVTTVLYGTAWTGDSLLERERQRNLELERQDGLRRHFQYDWRALAAILPEYGAYVAGERARLGAQHPLFRSQYELETLADEGRLLTAEQRLLLQGTHARQERPLPGRRYVAGVDLGGENLTPQPPLREAQGRLFPTWEGGHHGSPSPLEERSSPPFLGEGPGERCDAALRRLQPRRDSTVVTLAEVGPNPPAPLRYVQGRLFPKGEGGDDGTPPFLGEGLGERFPQVRVVQHYWWTGRPQVQVYQQLLALLRTWGVSRVAVDATGLGAGLASFLAAALGERVQQVVFTQASKSRLAFALLSAVNCGRLKLYAADSSPEREECWRQLQSARASFRANQTLNFYVPENEGHDDFVTSLALCLHAAEGAGVVPAATILTAGDVLDEEGWT